MGDTIIKVEGLGKKYTISHERKEGYTALRDVIAGNIKKIIKRPDYNLKEDFWALKDLNFEIKQGDAVGIIGRNGAGKSTLLKILSRITEPTHGRIELNGRVASLLEVGTGFHPELTGRENIFLNGAILGMSRIEIKQKFDEIVDFSGVEKFLDTPVKRYSSGMYVRLAFAVAAHLSSEILIVDEVLAVGDTEFQKKCLKKMDEIATTQGRTLLFVSHNMAAIQNLCRNAIILNKGTVHASGLIQDSIINYQKLINDSAKSDEFVTSCNNHNIEINYFAIENCLEPPNIVSFNQPIELRIKGKSNFKLKDVSFGMSLVTMENVVVFTTRLTDSQKTREVDGDFDIKVKISHNLRAGMFTILLGIDSNAENIYYNPAIMVIELSNISNNDQIYQIRNYGLIDIKSDWTFF